MKINEWKCPICYEINTLTELGSEPESTIWCAYDEYDEIPCKCDMCGAVGKVRVTQTEYRELDAYYCNFEEPQDKDCEDQN